jgi:hypothetical protein
MQEDQSLQERVQLVVERVNNKLASKIETSVVDLQKQLADQAIAQMKKLDLNQSELKDYVET